MRQPILLPSSIRISSRVSRSESGNAIWFILLAVVLMGLLTVVISRGGSSVDQTGNVERAGVLASQMLRYAKSVQQASMNLIALNGCSESDLGFDDSGWGDTAYRHTPESPERCQVFHPQGGGLSWQALPRGAQDFVAADPAWHKAWTITGRIRISGVGEDNANDLAMVAVVTKAVCAEINRQITGARTIPAEQAILNVDTKFTGSFAGSANLLTCTQGAGSCVRQQALCFHETQHHNKHVFYQILVAR